VPSDADRDAEIESLKVRVLELERRLRHQEKLADTYLETVWWRRWWFMLDGWPGYRIATRRAWRPWHK